MIVSIAQRYMYVCHVCLSCLSVCHPQHGLSALMKASEKGDLDMIQTLVAARAILDLKSKVCVCVSVCLCVHV